MSSKSAKELCSLKTDVDENCCPSVTVFALPKPMHHRWYASLHRWYASYKDAWKTCKSIIYTCHSISHYLLQMYLILNLINNSSLTLGYQDNFFQLKISKQGESIWLKILNNFTKYCWKYPLVLLPFCIKNTEKNHKILLKMSSKILAPIYIRRNVNYKILLKMSP